MALDLNPEGEIALVRDYAHNRHGIEGTYCATAALARRSCVYEPNGALLDDHLDDAGSALRNMVTQHVMPRLIRVESLAYDNFTTLSKLANPFSRSDIDSYITLLLDGSLHACVDRAQHIVRTGIPSDAVYLHLFAEVARNLGMRWENDQTSFFDVSLALTRLQNVITDLSQSDRMGATNATSRRIILAHAVGEQHNLGLSIVAECFRNAGWHALGGSGLSVGYELEAALRRNWYAVVGLSAATEGRARQLARHIRKLRKISYNPDIVVLVGGVAFERDPDLVTEINADCVADDALDAVRKAESLIKAELMAV